MGDFPLRLRRGEPTGTRDRRSESVRALFKAFGSSFNIQRFEDKEEIALWVIDPFLSSLVHK